MGTGCADDKLECFRSEVVDRVRAAGNVWRLGGGELRLPRVFGFCRGVRRALDQLDGAVRSHAGTGKRLVLLGEVIHNPWVNEYFRRRGVERLDAAQRRSIERHVGPADCAIIPAFGVPLPTERRLRAIGCEIVDCTCGDVRRLWAWAERAVRQDYAVLIFGRATHDETVVTKSRLAAVGGTYLVVETLEGVQRFCRCLTGAEPSESPQQRFGPEATNAGGFQPFRRLAQLSQTTMLYDETMKVQATLREAFARHRGEREAGRCLLFQPTVCRATQQRQNAAVELCDAGCDLTVVVGGVGSSNTRHLYELASARGPAYFVEDARALRSAGELVTHDFRAGRSVTVRVWLPAERRLRIAVLAGASCPEIVVGEVLDRLAGFLQGRPS